MVSVDYEHESDSEPQKSVTERTPLLAQESSERILVSAHSINASGDSSLISAAFSSIEVSVSLKPKQNSFFTMSGLSFGIIIMILVMGVCLYTAYRVIQLPSLMGVDMEMAEYSDLCDQLLKHGTKWIAIFFSVFALLGALVVYWILMSNFLYNIVSFVYFRSTNSSWTLIGNSSHTDVYCPNLVPEFVNKSAGHMNLFLKLNEDPEFDVIWNLNTSPIFLVLIVMCLANYKSATVFTKLNALAFTSVIFLFVFISCKAYYWGFNINVHDKHAWDYIPQFNWNFPALTGTLTLAFFIHNCNLLNNFHDADSLTFAARCFLLLQMLAVLPLIMYVIRTQVLHTMFQHQPHKYRHIIPINVILIGIGVLFAIYYPHISFLIRYTGALCGLVYTFALPCLTYMKVMHDQRKLTKSNIFIHSFLIALGVINLISQFFVTQRF
uniref:Amino acid transporter transmembrane domain-containing protein n=1 Tax=Strigamia maritima TaxID=126957 RepID=T1J6R2_STRMM